MRISDISLAITAIRGGGGVPDYAALVQSRLAGTVGFAMDPSDLTLLWQESTRTTPVSASGNPVGAQRSKYGTTPYDYIQATGSRIPASANLRSVAYATDDFLGEEIAQGFYQSLMGMTFSARCMITSLAAVNTLFAVSSSGSATTTRYFGQVTAAGAVSHFARRPDTGGTTVTSAAGLVTENVPFTFQGQVDYTNNVSRILLNGVEVATGVQDGTPGDPSAAGASLRVRWASTLASTLFLNGNLGRCVWSPSYLSAGDLAVDRGYVEAIAL